MHLHHSTVAHRVEHVEQALGFGLGEHSNWFRAQLAYPPVASELPEPGARTVRQMPDSDGRSPAIRRMTPASART